MNQKKFEKVLKDASAENKIKTGTKEVLKYLKGSKIIILSNSLTPETQSQIRKSADDNKIPVIDYPVNSVLLGKMCNLSYGTSAISIKNISDEQINELLKK